MFSTKVSNSNFGPSGNYDGPNQGGSNVSILQSVATAANWDWRNVSLLPLNVISLSGLRSNGVSKLNWKVANDEQVLYYVVEKSFDCSHFDSISIVASSQRVAAEYKFSDDKNFDTH